MESGDNAVQDHALSGKILGDKAGGIAAEDRDQDRDNGQEFAEQHAAQHRHAQRDAEGNDRGGGHAVPHDLASGGGASGQLEADQRDDRTHGGRRQHHVYPFGAAFVNDCRQDAAAQADHHEAAERIRVAPVLDDQRRRSDERERRA